jgi:flagellar hook-length control protein FliK
MTELASISTVTAETGARRRQEPMRGEAPFFNYAMAAASLEMNAAKSLEAHGAKPASASGAAKQTAAASPDVKPPNGSPKPDEMTHAKNEGAPDTASAPRQASFAPSKSSAANVAPLPPPAAPLAASGASFASTKPLEAAIVREIAAARKPTAALKAARQPAELASVKAEFAQILAKRLEKTSVFEIRLDPPDLGRVEGRLAIGDDGKAVLSLAFDNQNAFDLFSRDEEALRQALIHAGLDFAAGDFAFTFREPAQTQAPLMPSAPAPETPGANDPVFRADWSAGALDIRI